MIKYTLSIGLNDKDTKTQKIKTSRAFKIVGDILQDNGLDFTTYEAHGGYTHENGERVQETTIRAELLEFDTSIKDLIIKASKDIKKALNQESIALEYQNVGGDLI